MEKSKLTLSINTDLLSNVKQKTSEKHLTVSGIVENFFEFFINPYVYCFKCAAKFDSEQVETCGICTWIKCPTCGQCGCNLGENALKVAYQMRKVYEDLLMGRVNE